ncbi:short chain dehydrogenase [Mycolicibacterium sp. 3033]|nr:short chain dehydrogenase [Mycolicibacterium aurantiacum]
MSAETQRVVLVSGGSRGLGHAVTRRLGDAEGCVVTTGAEKASAQHALESLAARHGHLDALVLDASECLSLASHDPDELRAFHDAQRELVSLATPLMPPGARIVYVTNHQAHFFPHKAVPKGATAAMASMRAGETSLYAMRTQLFRLGIHLTVVSSERMDPTSRASTAMHELSAAVVAAITAHTPAGLVCVGGATYLMTA